MSSDTPLVIFAEDDHEDWILVSEALVECGKALNHERVENGRELLDRLCDTTKPLPHLIFLDLKMPLMDGREALRRIRADKRTKHIPVIILTTSKTEGDIFESFQVGASSYIVKPVTFKDMKDILSELYHYWTELSEMPLPSEVRFQCGE